MATLKSKEFITSGHWIVPPDVGVVYVSIGSEVAIITWWEVVESIDAPEDAPEDAPKDTPPQDQTDNMSRWKDL